MWISLSIFSIQQQLTIKNVNTCRYRAVDIWPTGWKGELSIPIAKTTANWNLHVVFNNPIHDGNFWQGSAEYNSDNTEVTVTSFDWAAVQKEGDTFVLGFTISHEQNVVS